MDGWMETQTYPNLGEEGRKGGRRSVDFFYGEKARLAPQLISFPEGRRRRQRTTAADAAAVRTSAGEAAMERNGVANRAVVKREAKRYSLEHKS